MDSSSFDKRCYPVVAPRAGYGEWAATYEDTVAVGLDEPLLAMPDLVSWAQVRAAADFACGTGRTGAFLARQGVAVIDGVDITPEMLALADKKRVYRSLAVADAAASCLTGAAYDLVTLSLADEHIAALAPVYREAARLLRPGGRFLLIGYHPFFIMNGMPTHFHRADGEAVTIETHIHLFADQFAAGQGAGLSLAGFRECVIDEAWLTTKPKWRTFLNWPVSFAMVWRKG